MFYKEMYIISARDEKKYNQAIDRKLLPFSPMVIIAIQLYGTCDFKDQGKS